MSPSKSNARGDLSMPISGVTREVLSFTELMKSGLVMTVAGFVNTVTRRLCLAEFPASSVTVRTSEVEPSWELAAVRESWPVFRSRVMVERSLLVVAAME